MAHLPEAREGLWRMAASPAIWAAHFLLSYATAAIWCAKAGVVAVAAPLLAIGLAGSRLDPAIAAPRWCAPIPASLLELAIVWAWHAPALHHAARHAS